jgi:putative ABC transport system permease protein
LLGLPTCLPDLALQQQIHGQNHATDCDCRVLGTLPTQLLRTLALEGMLLGGAGALLGAALAGAISLGLYVVPVQMPPPPGRSSGYPLTIEVDPLLFAATVFAMLLLAMAAAALVARRTVHTPVVDALAHT